MYIDYSNLKLKLQKDTIRQLGIIIDAQKLLNSEILSCLDKEKLSELNKKSAALKQQYETLANYDYKLELETAKIFNKLAKDLTNEFNASIDTDKYTIRFNWPGNTLIYLIDLLARKYNLTYKPGNKDSIYIYTKDNYKIKAGLENKTHSIILDFGQLDII